MPRTSFSVFLSSTSKDLAPHRNKVRQMVERLGQHDVGLASIAMETFGARPDIPLNTCLERVRAADALVVIVGHRYGWVPTADEGGDDTKSITWLEVTWALEAKKPVYAFLVDPVAPWSGEKEQDRLVEAKSDEEAAGVVRAVQGLKAFRAFLESKTTRELFTSADDLGGKVATSLAPLLRSWISMSAMSDGTAVSRVSGPATPPAPIWTGSPFPGLRSFTPLDAPIFFGRSRETDFLLEKLSDSRCRFLLVTGTSGSGKSSLVAAGLLPRLAEGALPGSEHWLLPNVVSVGQGRTWHGLRFTPGEQGPDPFIALASKLAPMLSGDWTAREVADALGADPTRLPSLVDDALVGKPRAAQALMFVDQFEELVTVVHDVDLRARFVTMLDVASRSDRLRIIGTVRADFSHRCIEDAAVLADTLRDRGHTVWLTVPGPAALLEMLNGPANRAGLTFDEGLTDELVNATVSRPGGLALLAFALSELYDARADGRLTAKALADVGGLAGVVNTRAEATFTSLPDAVGRQLAPVFRQLVVVDPQGVATRARVARDTVEHGSADAKALVAAFERARLIVADRTADGTPVLEVAHEALLREWPRLTSWIREHTDDLRLVQQVHSAAEEWARHSRSQHFAWPHERLVPVYDALQRLNQDRRALEEPARSFIREEWERLVEELERPSTSHQRRAAIGDRLDQIGDRRPGVGLTPEGLPDIVWCEVPGGIVDIETRGPVGVKPFRIAKYPITYRQYRAFLDDPNGYDDPSLWKGLEREAMRGEQYRPVGNHPAENVSSYDAVAFCRWLTARLGYEVRLPSEGEWQQAATSGVSVRPDHVS